MPFSTSIMCHKVFMSAPGGHIDLKFYQKVPSQANFINIVQISCKNFESFLRDIKKSLQGDCTTPPSTHDRVKAECFTSILKSCISQGKQQITVRESIQKNVHTS